MGRKTGCMEGNRIPDTPATPGRSAGWRPNEQTKITYEEHPYHPNAPDWHKGPHWHLDASGRSCKVRAGRTHSANVTMTIKNIAHPSNDGDSGKEAIIVVRQCDDMLAIAVSLRDNGDIEVLLDANAVRRLADAIGTVLVPHSPLFRPVSRRRQHSIRKSEYHPDW